VILLTAVACFLVFGVKYYTSVEMRKLEHRLETVKKGLQEVKDELEVTMEKHNTVSSEENVFQNRVSSIKELIQDLQFRLADSEEKLENIGSDT